MLARTGLLLLCPAMLIAQALPAGNADPAGGQKAAQAATLRAVEAQMEASRKAVNSVMAQYRSAAGPRPEATVETGGFFLLPSLGTAVPAAMASPAEDCQPLPPAEVNPIIERAAAREGLKPDVLRAIVKRESGYRSCAVSPKGALGLMQLMPATAERFGLADAFDPKGNIDTGARFLKELLGRYGGELRLALAAYNAGPGKVDEAGGIPPIPETQDYVREILAGLQ